jgi:hypothetical protein
VAAEEPNPSRSATVAANTRSCVGARLAAALLDEGLAYRSSPAQNRPGRCNVWAGGS